ncbi:MAG: CRTAC1 family protein [Planctomycetes bacterium]|nr:CRTAC1 family protein [Planctomycetota bacterium]
MILALLNKSFLRFVVIAGLVCISFLRPLQAKESITFTDVTDKTGITFKHTDGSSGKFYIMETVTAGLALFDYDNDGDIDIYFLNGAALKGTKYDKPPKNALYRNDGNFKFTDVTEQSGLGDTGFGLGVTAGDYDNDGDKDIYINNFGPNVLYRNNGDGTFSDVTKKAGVDNGNHVGAGTCFLDIDKDGDLDLYVARYIIFSYDEHKVMNIRGYLSYSAPVDYTHLSDSLYRNNGDGTFTDVSKVSGIGGHKGSGMGMVCVDYDNDGDTDIFVANDEMENYLFENDGTGKFEQVGLMAGVAYDFNGKYYGSMGVDCGDYDNDGLLDFYVTSFDRESATLYKNLGDGIFEDITSSIGAGKGTYENLTWGTGFADFDNDGDRDIFVAAGHLQPDIAKHSDHLTYRAINQLLMNTGDGKFVNITKTAGDGMKVKQCSRYAGFDDLDNDGDVDAVILNIRSKPTILRNDTVNNNHWIKIRLKGVKSNRDGIGAHVKVTAGGLVQLDEVHSGRGYQGHHGSRLYFGLGKNKMIEKIEVRWIGGGVDVLKNVKADQSITITEGKKTIQ